MRKFCLPLFAVVVLSGSTAEAAHNTRDAVADDLQKPVVVPPSPLPDPLAMQKWFGDAVDHMLTDTGRALDFEDAPQRADPPKR